MASAFSHAFAAFALGRTLSRTNTRVLVVGMVCAAIPDLDAIGFWMGIPYHSVWGHRGITHSLFFAALLAAVVMAMVFPKEMKQKGRWSLYAYLFLATASHGMLDALTDGGLGVAFFAPFVNDRYFFPFRPVLVSPISVSHFFSAYGWQVFKSELVWIWIPSAAVMGAVALIRIRKPS